MGGTYVYTRSYIAWRTDVNEQYGFLSVVDQEIGFFLHGSYTFRFRYIINIDLDISRLEQK